MTQPPDDLFKENERTAPQAEGRCHFALGDLPLKCGVTLPQVQVAYETWGTYNGDNAIVVCHALSGDSHCIGWWEALIGPGKAIDTDRYYVIGTNALGGCQGTTGPWQAHPEDALRYGSRFPEITVEDMVAAQARLCDHLGVDRLAAVIGGSMGGMQALEWARQFPQRVQRVWMTASCAAHNALQIGFNETARQAITQDPAWNGGDYDENQPPAAGLAVARMVGHLSYLSEAAFERKFAREKREDGLFQVASYLQYQGHKFIHRFDPASLVVLSQAIDQYDGRDVSMVQAEVLLTSFTSDWLYPSHQSVALAAALREAGAYAEWHEIDLPHGHDSFLLDGVHQTEIVREFLARDPRES